MEVCNGKITDISQNGITVFVPYTAWNRLALRQYDAAQVGFPDGRTISPDQRRKAYALMGEIAAWSGHSPSEIKLTAKRQYMDQHMEAIQKELFSLSNCDMTTAREFISYLIEFILTFDIPTSVPLVSLCEDVHQYVWHCLMHKKCAICGKKAEFHRVDRVGMGRDRREICHIGMRGLPLCRMHHMEAHRIGDDALMAEFHLKPVEVDEQIAKVYRMKGKRI